MRRVARVLAAWYRNAAIEELKKFISVVDSLVEITPDLHNNVGIALAWLKRLDDAQEAFTASMRTADPAGVTRARANRQHLQKLKAELLLAEATGSGS